MIDTERLASLETKVDLHKHSADISRQELKDKIEEMDKKLDTLLELRHKGAGAFWLASVVFGTGIVSLFHTFTTWFKGI